LLDKLDTNYNGLIEYSEFINGAIDFPRLLSQNRLENAFKFFDKDNNGYITLEEFK